ncbi:hypothetical protein CR513_29997, partial [Mucuna pruriens]
MELAIMSFPNPAPMSIPSHLQLRADSPLFNFIQALVPIPRHKLARSWKCWSQRQIRRHWSNLEPPPSITSNQTSHQGPYRENSGAQTIVLVKTVDSLKGYNSSKKNLTP